MTRDEERLNEILALLPDTVTKEIKLYAAGCADFATRLLEIRLRADKLCSLTLGGENRTLSVCVSAAQIADTVKRLCHGSLYAYAESLKEGYLTTAYGTRVGLAGRAVRENGRLTGLADVTSLSVRISRNIAGAGDFAVSAWREDAKKAGMLVYAPPGIGKTTLLRDFVTQIACGERALRVAVVDCRGELSAALFPRGALLDVLTGFEKAEGIEIAVRSLSPELLVCDEIGSEREAAAILSLQHSGVPLIATAHAAAVCDLYARAPIARLLQNGVFSTLLGISRTPAGYRYTKNAVKREDAVCC